MARTSGTSKNFVVIGSLATTRPIWFLLTTGASHRRALRVSTWQNLPTKNDVFGKTSRLKMIPVERALPVLGSCRRMKIV
jgi:hypothetical protein